MHRPSTLFKKRLPSREALRTLLILPTERKIFEINFGIKIDGSFELNFKQEWEG